MEDLAASSGERLKTALKFFKLQKKGVWLLIEGAKVSVWLKHTGIESMKTPCRVSLRSWCSSLRSQVSNQKETDFSISFFLLFTETFDLIFLHISDS